AKRLDRSMRRNRRTNGRIVRRAGLQCIRRDLRRAPFYRTRLVRLFSELIQSDAGRNARRRTHRDRPVALALVARFRLASLVRMEVSELRCLAHRASVAAAHLFAFPETD